MEAMSDYHARLRSTRAMLKRGPRYCGATGYHPQLIVPADFHGLFRCDSSFDGRPRVLREAITPLTIPCPTTGRELRVATIDANTSAICPSCARHGHGGYVSFDGDLRMAYACPQCRQLVWLRGA
jgi:hypothetical protein